MSYHSYDFENYKMTYRFKDYAQSKPVLVAFYGNHREAHFVFKEV